MARFGLFWQNNSLILLLILPKKPIIWCIYKSFAFLVFHIRSYCGRSYFIKFVSWLLTFWLLWLLSNLRSRDACFREASYTYRVPIGRETGLIVNIEESKILCHTALLIEKHKRFKLESLQPQWLTWIHSQVEIVEFRER